MSRQSLYPDTREHILAVGEVLIHGRSFTALGLSELLAEAKVPKGSFYHYFKSKEDFGVALLARYFAAYRERVGDLLADSQPGNGRERLLAYFQQWLDNHASCESQSCLAVKLAAEVSDMSEPMRVALSEGMDAIVRKLAACIRSGQQDGSIKPQLPADDTAYALYSLWLGAALMYKTQHSLAPLQAAMTHTQGLLLPCNAA